MLHCTAVLSEAGIKMLGTAGSPVMGNPIAGASAVIGPDGRLLSAANTKAESLIIADLDLSEVVKNKTFADASGHCMLKRPGRENSLLTITSDSRPDMLWLGAE